MQEISCPGYQMILFNGKKKAEMILSELKKQIEQVKAQPVLNVIFIGEDPASELFVRNKMEESEKIGIKINIRRFSADTQEKDIIEKIRQLNNDKNVNGIIVQLPLPPDLDAEKIINEIAPQKDVDGFGRETLFQPPLISAIMLALQDLGDAIHEKEILAIVNSDIFGATLKKFLSQKGLKVNYLLSEEISGKKDIIEKADIIITASGRPKFLKGDMIKKGAVLIDAGIVVSDFGKVIGDIDKDSVSEKADFLTPVPGGIGPLTVAYLLKNVFLAYHEHSKIN